MIKPEIGSEEWKAMRRKMVTASDSAVLMGCGFLTPYQLWCRKLTGEEEPDNAAMKRGRDLEPHALLLCECMVDTKLDSSVVVHPLYPWCMATLDGISEDGRLLFEVKCPGEKSHCEIVNGNIPSYYYAQCQMQLACTSLEKMWLFTYRPESETPFKAIEIHRDQDYISELMVKAKEFFVCLESYTPPPLTAKDSVEIIDEFFEQLVECLKHAKKQKREWEDKEGEIEARLKTYADANKCNVHGFGCKIIQFPRKGNIDYAAIPELEGVDLDKYRKKSSTIFRITLT